LRDFITYKVHYPLQNFISYTNTLKHDIAFLMFISKEQEPTQYYDAIKNEKWCKAIREELNVF
jgi:hypothetical protein